MQVTTGSDRPAQGHHLAGGQARVRAGVHICVHICVHRWAGACQHGVGLRIAAGAHWRWVLCVGGAGDVGYGGVLRQGCA